MDEKKKNLLRQLPKMDDILLALEKWGVFSLYGKGHVIAASRAALEEVRGRMIKDDISPLSHSLFDDILERIEGKLCALSRFRLRRVINATGVVLHTNLGRAPLCDSALAHIIEVSRSYSNLEYDTDKGERGLRYNHVRELLCALSGAEDALVVNNNAAAVLLVLDTLAHGREAIVSRGELVEIGGEFRIPAVMEKSGAVLREVGTTNRTRLADYEGAISEQTGLIMKVHTSNFRIVGFTEETPLESLVLLGKKYGLPVMDDLGSGCMIDLSSYGLGDEPAVPVVMKTGVDVVTISGDKLLGGPQAGIILGTKKILASVMKNPLNRALRVDKLTLAALEATLIEYLHPEKAVQNIHILRSLTESLARTRARARKLASAIRRIKNPFLSVSLKHGVSAVGGGALPTREMETTLVSLRHAQIPATRLEKIMRQFPVPVIARIDGDEVLLDVRTVRDEEFPLLCREI
ncbi:MAG: L-seryl-tRNA(Sec) selenium transferase [Syntrophobacterales bacterium]|nr:L-seryl-tRNA(Sec) selenium transferase [Syntrophobacterales bacterium]